MGFEWQFLKHSQKWHCTIPKICNTKDGEPAFEYRHHIGYIVGDFQEDGSPNFKAYGRAGVVVGVYRTLARAQLALTKAYKERKQ